MKTMIETGTITEIKRATKTKTASKPSPTTAMTTTTTSQRYKVL